MGKHHKAEADLEGCACKPRDAEDWRQPEKPGENHRTDSPSQPPVGARTANVLIQTLSFQGREGAGGPGEAARAWAGAPLLRRVYAPQQWRAAGWSSGRLSRKPGCAFQILLFTPRRTDLERLLQKLLSNEN